MALVIRTTGIEEYLDPSGGAWIKLLQLGNHGVGKTPSAAAWPQPIFADCERGMASVASRAVPYAPVRSIADMEALLDHVRRDSLLPPEQRKYRTFVLDTIDTYQKIVMSERMRTERRDSLTMQDWGFIGTKLNQVIEKLLNLPINIVVNMHLLDEKDTDGETEILVKKSALKGSLGTEIYNHFDLIGLMESAYVAEEGERTLKRQIRWHSEPKYPMLRDRFGRLPRFTDIDFTDQDYFRIFNAIAAGTDELPESVAVETLATEDDGEVAPAEVKGGPVSNPETPRAPAKKAAAKKAAAPAKKAAVEPAAEVQKDVAATEEAKPVTDETETAKAEAKQEAQESPAEQSPAEAAEAEALVKEELGATEVDDNARSDQVAKAMQQREVATPAASEKPIVACGSPVVKDGTPLAPGCGVVLDESNSSKVQIGRLKFKGNFCEDCYGKAVEAKKN